jgi:hypothetical protein
VIGAGEEEGYLGAAAKGRRIVPVRTRAGRARDAFMGRTSFANTSRVQERIDSMILRYSFLKREAIDDSQGKA